VEYYEIGYLLLLIDILIIEHLILELRWSTWKLKAFIIVIAIGKYGKYLEEKSREKFVEQKFLAKIPQVSLGPGFLSASRGAGRR
jgi:hypothetical protein